LLFGQRAYRSCHSRENGRASVHLPPLLGGNPESGHQGLIKKVLSRFALLSGFRIKCGMTEFIVFDTLDTLLFAAG